MSDRLDAILRVATIADVLQLANVALPTRERENIRCPLPGHEDGTPSFTIQSSGRGYRCHGCGGHGGVLELVVAMDLARDRARAVDRLGQRYGIEAEPGNGFRGARRAAMSSTFELRHEPEREATAEDQMALRAALRERKPLAGTDAAEYLESRGICWDAADANDVRFHANWLGGGPAVLFALRDRKRAAVAAQGRFIAPHDPKTKTKSKGPVSLGVYATAGALDRMTQVVAIVEAPIDALTLAVCELPAIALCGASNRPAWLRRELYGRSVILATDNDAAGDAAASDLKEWLNLRTRTSRLALPTGVKDVNELLVGNPAALLDIAREARFAALPDMEVEELSQTAS